MIVILAMIDDHYFPGDWQSVIIISLFRGSAIVISAMKFACSWASSLCYLPANSLPVCSVSKHTNLHYALHYMLAYMFDSFVWTRLNTNKAMQPFHNTKYQTNKPWERGTKNEPWQETRASYKTLTVLTDTWIIFCYS